MYDDSCPTCGGAQYVRVVRPVGDPLFGKMRACPTCWGGSGTFTELGTKIEKERR